MSIKRENIMLKYRPDTLDDLVGNCLAKTITTNLVLRDGFPNGILIHGGTGCGKTTLARIIAKILRCHGREPGSAEPCGKCEWCVKYQLRESIFAGEGVATRNATELTLAKVRADHVDTYYAGEYPTIFFYDEFHRARERIQDYIVTWLEDETPNFVLIISTLKPEEIEEPLLRRLIPIKMEPPQPSEMAEHLRYVCSDQGWSYDESVLAGIVRGNRSEPRACLNALSLLRSSNSLCREM